MSDGFTPELLRYVDLRSTWDSALDAFNWLVGQVKKSDNGESTDSYSMGMAARDLIIDTLVHKYEWDKEEAIKFVAGTGALQLEIQDHEGAEQLVLGWQSDDREIADIFVYALDNSAAEEETD